MLDFQVQPQRRSRQLRAVNVARHATVLLDTCTGMALHAIVVELL